MILGNILYDLKDGVLDLRLYLICQSTAIYKKAIMKSFWFFTI